MPDGIRQRQLAAQQHFEKVLAHSPNGHGQCDGHEGVQHGGLPLDKTVVMQYQGEGAKSQNQHQRDLVHDLQLAVYAVNQGHLQDGGAHQHAGGSVNVVKLVGAEKQQQGEKVDQYFHAGLKCSEAEFMQ